MENRFEKALAIMLQAHRGQKDKLGQEYVLHPLQVMANLGPDATLSERIVAIMHDVFEDSNIQFGDPIVSFLTGSEEEALYFLTKKKGQSYEDYLSDLTQSKIAVKVKKADLRHNMEISRLCIQSQKDFDRMKKYASAYSFLSAFY